MNKESKLKSQIANLEAQNARVIKEAEKYRAFWIASEKSNEELEESLATSQIEANDLRQERDGLKQMVEELLK